MQLTHVHEQHTALPIIHALTPTHILPVVCDPVMGDDSRLYVPEELVPIFREELCPLADVLTPNHYEAEYEYPCLFPPPRRRARAFPSSTVSVRLLAFGDNSRFDSRSFHEAHARVVMVMSLFFPRPRTRTHMHTSAWSYALTPLHHSLLT